LGNVNNYQRLLNLKCKEHISIIILPIIIIVIIILSSIISVYDKVSFIYLYNNEIVVTVPIESIDYVIHGNYVVIDNQKYSYDIVDISEIQSSSGINYQNISINIKEETEIKNNQTGTISFYSNKEKIIKKIFNIFFWKG